MHRIRIVDYYAQHWPDFLDVMALSGYMYMDPPDFVFLAHLSSLCLSTLLGTLARVFAEKYHS